MHDWRAKLDEALALPEADRPQWLRKITSAPPPPHIDQRGQFLGLSGGKDSTALALATAYFEPGGYRYLITPTGDELPVMVAHWATLEEMLGARLEPVNERTLPGLVLENRAIPNHTQRWCTKYLKLFPYYAFLKTQGPAVSYIGLRADEETRSGMVFPNTDHVQMEFPMQRWGWTLDDVVAFLVYLGVSIPERTDCALCFWQALGEWYELWRDHPKLYERGETLETFVSAVRGREYTFRSPSRDTWPASLKDLRAEFERGRVPTISLNKLAAKRRTGLCRVCTL